MKVVHQAPTSQQKQSHHQAHHHPQRHPHARQSLNNPPQFITSQSSAAASRPSQADTFHKINQALIASQPGQHHQQQQQRSASIILQSATTQQQQQQHPQQAQQQQQPHNFVLLKNSQQQPQRTLSFNPKQQADAAHSTSSTSDRHLIKLGGQQQQQQQHGSSNGQNSNSRMLVGLRYPSQIMRNEQVIHTTNSATATAANVHTTQVVPHQTSQSFQPTSSKTTKIQKSLKTQSVSKHCSKMNALNLTPPTTQKQLLTATGNTMSITQYHQSQLQNTRITYQYPIQVINQQQQQYTPIKIDNRQSPINKTLSQSNLTPEHHHTKTKTTHQQAQQQQQQQQQQSCNNSVQQPPHSEPASTTGIKNLKLPSLHYHNSQPSDQLYLHQTVTSSQSQASSAQRATQQPSQQQQQQHSSQTTCHNGSIIHQSHIHQRQQIKKVTTHPLDQQPDTTLLQRASTTVAAASSQSSTSTSQKQQRNRSALKHDRPLFIHQQEAPLKVATTTTTTAAAAEMQRQEAQKINLDFAAGYDCGDEPSEEDDEKNSQNSLSRQEDDEDFNDQYLSCSSEDDGPTTTTNKSKNSVNTEQFENAMKPQKQMSLVSGDIFLLGGGHVLQSSTDTSPPALDLSSGSLKKSLKKSKRRKLKSHHERAIREEEENQEEDTNCDQESQINTAQLKPADHKQSTQDRQKKLAEREAYLRRPPNQTVTLIKSQFPNQEPFLFFPYPPYLKVQRTLPPDYSRIVQYNQKDLPTHQQLGFKFHHSTHTYNGVVNSLKMAGFYHMPQSNNWNVLWTGLFKAGRIKNLNPYQNVNHFAGSWCIGRKDLMWRNVQRMRRIFGPSFEIAPTTYILPEDYKRWQNDREMANFKSMYIMKPAASSCGRGIRVIGKKTHVNKRSGYIVSKYLSKPHLIRGYKYDLRVYVLVTSFEPLKVYLFSEGLVRLATVPYTTSKSSLKQRFVHLTNYSVNKKADSYQKNNLTGTEQSTQEEEVQSKLSFAQLRKEYDNEGADFDATLERIKDVIIKTILSVEQPIVTAMGGIKHKQTCFEIYGFDILVDQNFKPWLLEVNVSPSLSSSSPMDKYIKTLLLSDSLYLTGFRLFDRKILEKQKSTQNKQRLLGFDTHKAHQSREQSEQSPLIPQLQTQLNGKQGGEPLSATQPTKFYGKQTPLSSGKAQKPQLHAAWLKDLSPLEGCNPSSGGGPTNIMQTTQDNTPLLVTNQQDLESLVQFEEERERKGHFSLIFPLKGNVDGYRPYFQVQRRSNIVLWSYIKQNMPIEQLKQRLLPS